MIKSMNIAWWVQRWSELYPQKPALLFEGQQLSYAELHQRANQTSCWLQSIGIEKGDRVAVMLNNCPEFIELYLACSRLGAVFVPINFRLAVPEIDYTLKNCRPRLFVFGDNYLETFLELDSGKNLPLMLAAMVGRRCELPRIFDYLIEIDAFRGKEPFLTRSLGPADPEEPQVIMYTSGTTGQPKGAVLTHRKTFFNCLNADLFFKLHFDDNMLIILPLFHSGGLFIQASPVLYKGATMVIHPRFDPDQAFADIQRYRITKFLGVPTVYRALLKIAAQGRDKLSSLKVSAIGGEKTTPELLAECQAAGFPLRQIMGQTETSILLWASEEDSLRKPGTVGRPVFHAEVGIVDRLGRRVRPGEIGEIVVRGSIMMKEYWQDPERTEETIRSGWLHTGDLAFMDEDGYYYLVDRAIDMYISGGENVYPAEVEMVLKQHPGIQDVAVVGVADERWGEVGQAFVIPGEGAALHANDVIAFCEGRLARFKWPKTVVLCQEFPRTPLGKVKKKVLRSSLSQSGGGNAKPISPDG
jgi:fatty-acyl-CoA synthase